VRTKVYGPWFSECGDDSDVVTMDCDRWVEGDDGLWVEMRISGDRLKKI
jgi:hypothetical protein